MFSARGLLILAAIAATSTEARADYDHTQLDSKNRSSSKVAASITDSSRSFAAGLGITDFGGAIDAGLLAPRSGTASETGAAAQQKWKAFHSRTALFPQYKGMNAAVSNLAANHVKTGTLPSALTKQFAIIGYTDPIVLESVKMARDEGHHSNSFNVTRIAAMPVVADQVSLMELNACIQNRLDEYDGSMHLAASSCFGDKVVAAPTKQFQLTKGFYSPADIIEANQKANQRSGNGGGTGGFNTDINIPNPGIGIPGLGNSNPTALAANSKNAEVEALTKAAGDTGFVSKNGPQNTRPVLLSELIFEERILALTGDDQKKVTELKADFKNYIGDVSLTYVNGSESFDAPFIIENHFRIPAVKAADLPPKIAPTLRQSMALYKTMQAWNMLMKHSKGACDYKVKSFDINTDRIKDPSYWVAKMKLENNEDPRAELSLPKTLLTQTMWDLLVWMATQGRTFKSLEKDQGCDFEKTFTDVTEFKKLLDEEEANKFTDPKLEKRKNMVRAYLWYSRFVGAGKTATFYREMYERVLETGLSTVNNPGHFGYARQGLEMVLEAAGTRDPGDLIDRERRIGAEMQLFIDRLRKYRSGSYNTQFTQRDPQSLRNGVDSFLNAGRN